VGFPVDGNSREQEENVLDQHGVYQKNAYHIENDNSSTQPAQFLGQMFVTSQSLVAFLLPWAGAAHNHQDDAVASAW
jgi:hypothetical protein